MTKQTFLDALGRRLFGIPSDDRLRLLEYYSEMIEEHIDNGATEEQAVAALGNMEDILNHILGEIPLSKIVKERIRPQRKMSAWEIVLLCVGSPIWLSLLIAAAAVVFSVYVSLWSVVLSVFAVTLALSLSGIACLPAAILSFAKGDVLFGTCLLGAGAVCLGIGILFFLLCKPLLQGILFLGCKILLVIKRCFVKKEVEQ